MKPPKLLSNLLKQAEADKEKFGYDHAMSQLAQKILLEGGRVLEVSLSIYINKPKAELISFTLEESASSLSMSEAETPYALTLALLGHLESERAIAGLKAQLGEIRLALESFPEDACPACLEKYLPFFNQVQNILSRSINEKSEEFRERQTNQETQPGR